MCQFFDITFKIETLLNSLAEIYRVTSILEMLLFFVAMIFFLIGIDYSTWYGVLSLFHVARAFVGFCMGRVIPSSYDFVEKLETKGNRQMEYRLVGPQLKKKVRDLIIDYYKDFEMVARLYTILSLISFGLDVISFFIVFGFLAAIQSDVDDVEVLGDDAADLLLTTGNPHLGRIVVIMLYTICDIIYLLWVLHFRSRLGEDSRGYILKALLGFGN